MFFFSKVLITLNISTSDGQKRPVSHIIVFASFLRWDFLFMFKYLFYMLDQHEY